MPKCQIKDRATNQTIEGINFGGTNIYDVNGTLVYAPLGGTSITIDGVNATLNPLNITTQIIGANQWEIVSHQNVGTANWRITVKNTTTLEEKSGVYPFNLSGKVYKLECETDTWVMASCGGYKIESSWSGQQANEFYRLKGTGEIIRYIGV